MKTNFAFKCPTIHPRYFSEFWRCNYILLDVSRKSRSICELLESYGAVCALLQRYRDNGCYIYRLERALSVYFSIRLFFIRKCGMCFGG